MQFSRLTLRPIEFFRIILLVLIAQTRVAQAVSDCTMQEPSSGRTPELNRGCSEQKEMGKKLDDCISIGDSVPGSLYIRKPGHYCLVNNVHSRMDFADHPAEGKLISIMSGDVILDLQGHTLGRGRIFKNPGGSGISIGDQYQLWKWLANSKNIVIKNGVLQDFDIGITYNYSRWDNPVDGPQFDTRENAYHFPANNITLENITFKNNKKDFDIRIPSKASADNPEYERRRKSQYPPCGGTDDFGRPLPPGAPCDDGK